ncbi:glycosyltransferase [Formosimonas limnophila]|uniref:glycosyltransferase n=1 Tax=Formosimonas limnophila TaxID=1384487 RepID=UPI001678D0A0|nr:glycosyltransferase [Formosimonas limnophila]
MIFAHPGWGETLYVKNVFPKARLIHFCEWYYRSQGADMNFDAEFPDDFNAGARVETWNALHALNLVNCDAAVTPTQWQLKQHPEIFHSKIKVIHEGVDMSVLYPDAQAELTLPDGFHARAGMPIITYVARQLEPYRGFHSFMRALSIIQKVLPDCHTIIIGGDDVSYGSKPRDAANFREKMLKEVRIDASRTHFLGQVPYDMYRKVLQVSRVHTYLTYPFVLSWSMLEAMAMGCLVVGSRTSPVEEVIRDGENGLLADFFDPQDIAEKVVLCLREPMSELRAQARADVLARYDFAQAEPAFRALLSG